MSQMNSYIKFIFRTYYPSHMKEHVKSIHDKIKDLVCDICGFKTSRKSHLKEHIKVIHHNIRDHACPQCNYTTTRNWLLKDHIKAVHDKIKDIVCDICGYRTASMANLGNHVKQAHANNLIIRCEQCDYRTYHAKVLKTHVKQVHKNEFDFVCEFCPYKTATEQGMVDHVEAVHKTDSKFVASSSQDNDDDKTTTPRMLWNTNAVRRLDTAMKSLTNVANSAEEFTSSSNNSTPQKSTSAKPVQQLPPLLALPKLPKKDEGTQNHIGPDEPEDREIYDPVPMAFKREYDAEELMDYPDDYEYEDAYDDDVFKMEEGEGEEDEEDPEFYPDELLQQGRFSVLS